MENWQIWLGGVAGLFATATAISKSFRDLWMAPFRAKEEKFMLDSKKLQAIREEQESQRETITKLNNENKELLENTVAQRKQMYVELEKMEELLKDAKTENNKIQDFVDKLKRYNTYLEGLLMKNDIKFKEFEEWNS